MNACGLYWYFYDKITLYSLIINLLRLDIKHCTVVQCGKTRNYGILLSIEALAIFWQKFRESNGFIKSVAKDIISRNFFSVSLDFCTALWCSKVVLQTSYFDRICICIKNRKILYFGRWCGHVKYSSNQLKSKVFVRKLILRN